MGTNSMKVCFESALRLRSVGEALGEYFAQEAADIEGLEYGNNPLDMPVGSPDVGVVAYGPASTGSGPSWAVEVCLYHRDGGTCGITLEALGHGGVSELATRGRMVVPLRASIQQRDEISAYLAQLDRHLRAVHTI